MDYPRIILSNKIPQNFQFESFQPLDKEYKYSEEQLKESFRTTGSLKNKSKVDILEKFHSKPQITPNKIKSQDQYYYQPNEPINHYNKQKLKNYLEEQRRNYDYIPQREEKNFYLKNSLKDTSRLINRIPQRFYHMPSSRVNNVPKQTLLYLNKSRQQFLPHLKPSYRLIRPKRQDSHKFISCFDNQEYQSLPKRKMINNNQYPQLRRREVFEDSPKQELDSKIMLNSEISTQNSKDVLRMKLNTDSSRINNFKEKVKCKNFDFDLVNRIGNSSYVSNPGCHPSRFCRDLYANNDMRNFKLNNQQFAQPELNWRQIPQLYYNQKNSHEVPHFDIAQDISNESSHNYSGTNCESSDEKYKNVMFLKKYNDAGYNLAGRNAYIEPNNSQINPKILKASHFRNSNTDGNAKDKDDLYSSSFIQRNKEQNNGETFKRLKSTFDLSIKPESGSIPANKDIGIHMENVSDPTITVISSQSDSNDINRNSNPDGRYILMNNNYPLYKNRYPLEMHRGKADIYYSSKNYRDANGKHLEVQNAVPYKTENSKFTLKSEILKSLLMNNLEGNEQFPSNSLNTVTKQNKIESYLEHSQSYNTCNKRQFQIENISPVETNTFTVERNNIPCSPTIIPEKDTIKDEYVKNLDQIHSNDSVESEIINNENNKYNSKLRYISDSKSISVETKKHENNIANESQKNMPSTIYEKFISEENPFPNNAMTSGLFANNSLNNKEIKSTYAMSLKSRILAKVKEEKMLEDQKFNPSASMKNILPNKKLFSSDSGKITNKNVYNTETQIKCSPNIKNPTFLEIKTEEMKLQNDENSQQYRSYHKVFPKRNHQRPINEKLVLNKEQKLNSRKIIVTFPKDLQVKLLQTSNIVAKRDTDTQTDETFLKNQIIADIEGNETKPPINTQIPNNHKNYTISAMNGKSPEHGYPILKHSYKRGELTDESQPVTSENSNESAEEKCLKMGSHRLQNRKDFNKLHSGLLQNDNSSFIENEFPDLENPKLEDEEHNSKCLVNSSEVNEDKLSNLLITNRKDSIIRNVEKSQVSENRNEKNLSGENVDNFICETSTSRPMKKLKTYSHISPTINVLSDSEDCTVTHCNFQRNPKILQSQSKVCLEGKATGFEKCTPSKDTDNRNSQNKKTHKKPSPRQKMMKYNSHLAKDLEKYSKRWTKEIQKHTDEMKKIRLKYWLQVSTRKNVTDDDVTGRIEEDAFEVLVKHVADEL